MNPGSTLMDGDRNPTPPPDPQAAERERPLALLRALLEKTRAGRLAWAVSDGSVSATAAGSLYFQFVVAPGLEPPFERRWERFTAVDAGREILRLERPLRNEAAIRAGQGAGPQQAALRADPLLAAAETLYRAATGSPASPLERAMDRLNRI